MIIDFGINVEILKLAPNIDHSLYPSLWLSSVVMPCHTDPKPTYMNFIGHLEDNYKPELEKAYILVLSSWMPATFLCMC